MPGAKTRSRSVSVRGIVRPLVKLESKHDKQILPLAIMNPSGEVTGSAGDLSILVVGSDPSERQRLVQAMGSLGIYGVQEANDQFEALVLSTTVPFDLVVHCMLLNDQGQPQFPGDASMLSKTTLTVTSGSVSPTLIEIISPLGEQVGSPLFKQPARGPAQAPARPARVEPSTTAPSASELVAAIRHKELTLIFKPMVSLKDMTLAAAEASPQWLHARYGLLLPEALLQAATSTESQVNLALYTFERALDAQQRFLKQGLPLSLHIDLGPAYFQQLGAANQLLGHFLDYPDSEPHLLTFDIHDAALVQPSKPFLDNLARLHSKGFGLALAHFAALSSPQQLTQIPFNCLKLNPTHLMRSEHRDQIPQIVAASRGLASHLGIKFVVQGIHRAEEWEVAKSLGCHLVQGPVIANPLDEQAFLDWIKAHEKEEETPEPAGGLDFLIFCYILSVAQDMGVSWVNTLKLVKAHNPAAEPILDRLEHSLLTGQALSVAMRAHPTVFSERVVAMVEGGEEVSKLSKVLRRLYDRTLAQVKPMASSGLEVPAHTLAQTIEDTAEFMDLGFPLSKAIQQAMTACESASVRAGLQQLHSQLESEGEGDLGSLNYPPRVFSRYASAFFAVGQMAGCLPETLRDLAALLRS